MKYTLKHRLVGAAVLAAFAVLFLPSFFKEKQAHVVSTKSQIPTRPGLVPVEFNAPQPVAGVEPAPPPETMFVPNESAAEPQIVSSSISASSTASKVMQATSSQATSLAAMPLNAQGLPSAWVVQVGSFATKEAAQKVRDDLQADGLKAYMRTVVSGSGSISRVYIGPKLDKSQAQAIKIQIDKRLKVNSIVMHFQP